MREQIKNETPEKPPKGMNLEECVRRADRFLALNGVYLLVMDIVGSRDYPDRAKLFADYCQLLTDLNNEFQDYLPTNSLTSRDRIEQGFNPITGDGATAGVNDSSVIEKVMEFAKEHPTAIPLRYAVAEDGYDYEGIRLLR
jgi:hypothetical protein